MSTNYDYNSKKIIEEIEKLENDKNNPITTKGKMLNFFEVFLLSLIIIIIIIIVMSSFFEENFENYEYNYDYYDNYDSYEYDKPFTEIQDKVIQEDIIQENNVYKYETEEILEKEFEEQKKNLVIQKEGMSINNELIISIENKNMDFVYDLSVYIVFYQEDNIIGIYTQNIDIIVSNNKKYLKAKEIPKTFDNYDVFITKNYYSGYDNIILNEYVGYTSSIENDLIDIKIKNDSKNKINRINLTILYYDINKNLLDIDEVSDFNIRSNSIGHATGYGVWNEELEKYIEYSDYEVILDYAECYD